MTLTRYDTQTLHTSAVNYCNNIDKNTFELRGLLFLCNSSYKLIV
jgi:hypothetical protein